MIPLQIHYFHCYACGSHGTQGSITILSINFVAGCTRCGNNDPRTTRLHGTVIDPTWQKLPKKLLKELV